MHFGLCASLIRALALLLRHSKNLRAGDGVRAGVGREFGGVIGYDVTKDELVRVANALK